MAKRHITRIWILLAVLVVATTAHAQQPKMTALFSYSTFNIVEGDPYVETYVDYDAWNLSFVPSENGQYQATVETILSVSSGDSIVFAKKYDLHSPLISDTTKTNFNFLDLQRFALKNGIYNLRMELRDKNSDATPTVVEQKIVLLYERKPQMSSLQMMSRITPTVQKNILSRGGYDMEPYINDYLPAQVQHIYYYYEIYHLDRELFSNEFITLAFIEQQETGHKMPGIEKIRTHNAAPTIPVAGGLDLRTLPSGNYNLVVEVRNKKNELMMYQKIPFMRNNPGVKAADIAPISTTFAGRIEDENLLNFYLKNLYPIASALENSEVAKLTKQPGLIPEKQELLYKFWVERNSMDPEGEWRKYKERIDYVAAHFTHSNISGYLTDRGRVYLKYGPPNFIRDEKNIVGAQNMKGGFTTSDEDDPAHIYYLPFQMWRYDQLPANQPNRMFVFWDQYRSGLYKLLQSNAIGETITPDWERELSQKQLREGSVGDVGRAFERGF